MKTNVLKLLFFTLWLVTACSKEKTSIPDSSLQLILAIADSVNGSTGTIAVFEREHAASPWKKVFDEAPMVVGRNGLAWGKGMHHETVMQGLNLKKEGDGRSPAGMFELAEVFGYAPNDSINMPFLLLD